MKKKIIICVLILILLAGGALAAFLFLNKKSSDEKKSYIGKYHTDDYFGIEASIELKKDNKCTFSDNKNECTWKEENDEILLTITSYKMVGEDGKKISSDYAKQSECEGFIIVYKELYKQDNLHCEVDKTINYKAQKDDGNISLNNKVFTKE
jgi:hypothetical protein